VVDKLHHYFPPPYSTESPLDGGILSLLGRKKAALQMITILGTSPSALTQKLKSLKALPERRRNVDFFHTSSF